jgi:hypothetical protein
MSAANNFFRAHPLISTPNSRLYSLMTVPVLLFFVIPGVVVYNNPNDFLFVDATLALSFSLAATLLTGLVLFVIELLLVAKVRVNIYRKFLRLLFLFLFIVGIYLPLSSITGMEAIAKAPIIWSNLIAATILTSIIFGLTLSRFQATVNTIILVIFGLNFLVAVFGFIGLYTGNSAAVGAARENFATLSERRNIFVISFDGIPRDIAVQALQADAEIRGKFSDFRVFTNVFSSMPSTHASISAEMYGNMNFKTEAQTEDELRGLDASRLITNRLESHGFNVSTYGMYGYEFKNSDHQLMEGDFFDKSLGQKAEDILFAYDYIIVLTGTRYTLALLNKSKGKHLLASLADELDLRFQITQQQTAEEKVLSERIDYSFSERWDKPQIRTIMDYMHYLDGLRVNETSDVAHFMHFTFTHFPVDFDRECRFRSDEAVWHRNRQNEAGMNGETYCALTKMIQFLTRLKELGVYDRSLIVLKSDHGKPSNYYDKSKLLSFYVQENGLLGYSRYTPLLMVKDFHSRSEGIDFDDNPAMLDDLARTLCIRSKIKADCTAYPGFDLLDPELRIPEETEAVIFVGKNRESNFMYDTHEALHLSRNKDFYHTIHDAMISKLLRGPIDCDQAIPIKRFRPVNNGFSDYRSWVTWSEGEIRFLKFKLGRCPSTIFIQVESAPTGGAGPTFTVEINGQNSMDRIAADLTKVQSASSYRIPVSPADRDDDDSILVGLIPAEGNSSGGLEFTRIDFQPGGSRH